jgi:hypothetical protein
MKKKMGSSKSMKKYGMGGASGPGDDQFPITAGAMRKTKVKERSADGDYVKKTVTRETPGGTSTTTKVKRSIQGILHGAPRIDKFKKGGSVGTSKKPKMSKGGSFGMLSVKAGVDNNPKPTAADRIAGAKMKKGGSVGKPKMKMGGSMKSKKC